MLSERRPVEIEEMDTLSPRYLPRILLVLPVEAPSATIYITRPLSELARQKKLVFDKVAEEDVSLAQIQASDVVLFCRNREPASDWILQECLASGIPTVYDLDDNFWEVPLDLHYAQYFRAPHRIAQLERYLSNVDVVRVYSPRLFEKVQAYSDRVRLVNPCIDVSLVPESPLPKKDTKIRITYVTGRGKQDALLNLFSDDLEKILEEYPDTVEFYWWAEIPDRFKDHPACKQVPILHDYAEFLHYLSHEGFDIGLAPLTPTSFNLSKTNTKFRDYGACRIAGIYSDVSVYEAVEHERTGLLVDEKSGAWYRTMKRLIEEPDLRRDIQEGAYRFVYDNYRQEFVERGWLELIDSLIDSQAAYPSAPPTPARAVQLNIGGRSEAPAGSIALGPAFAPGVDLVARPDCLPLASDSFDRVLIEDTLEYAADPDAVLREVYRAARHAAQVCAVLPYTRPEHAVSNPRHRRLFNERTPGLWTPSRPPVYDREEIARNLTEEDLAAIEGSRPAFDVRAARLEFFYAADYLYTDRQERSRLRMEVPQACDFMLLQALVVKEELPEGGFDRLVEEQSFFEPAAVTRRRLADQAQFFKIGLDLQRNEYESLLADLELKEKESRESLEIVQHKLQVSEAELNRLRAHAELTAANLDSYRSRRLSRIIERMLDRTDVSVELPPLYRQLYDDSLIFTRDLNGFLLQPSANLQRVPFLAYPIEPGRPNLCAVHLAPLIDIPAQGGRLGIEIVSGAGEILANSVLPAEEIFQMEPAVFRFQPIATSGEGPLELRVFAREVSVPLRIYEWRRYLPLSAGPVRKKAFCGFSFCDG